MIQRKTYILVMIFIITITFQSCAPTDSSLVIDASNYGLKDGEDITVAISNALKDCKKKKAFKLVIPKGTYHLYPEKAQEKYLHITNNDDGLKRIAFPIEGFKDFEIDAQGSSFICHDYIVPFHLENSSDVTLKNFSIDWAMPFYFQAEVVAVHPEKNAFDLKVFQECIYEIQGSQLIFTNKKMVDNAWMKMAPPSQNDVRWTQDINWNIWFDKETKAPMFNVENPARLYSWNKKLNKQATAEEIEDNMVRLYDASSMLPEVGWTLIIKGNKEDNRLAPAINIDDCKDTYIDNVNVHHSSGIALIAQKSENITLQKYNVMLPENSGRLVSTTADATHFNACKGLIKMDDCIFENMLDDATNVHGSYAEVKEFVDAYTLGMARGHSQQQGMIFASKGEKVVLVNRSNIMPIDTLTVKSVKEINSTYFELTFNEKIPNVDPLSIVADNADWQADVVMTNCIVRNNRARSILLKTSGEHLVENNHFYNCTYTGVLVSGANVGFWYESGPVTNLTIRNNVFENMGLGAGNAPVLTINVNPDVQVEPPFYIHKNIVFSDNLIKTFSRKVISAASVENLKISNNTIVRSESYPVVTNEKGPAFTFSKSKNVTVEGNKYNWGNTAKVNATASENVISKNNLNIEDLTY